MIFKTQILLLQCCKSYFITFIITVLLPYLCCLGPKTVIGYPGEAVTISCPYPEEFHTNTKIFFKQSRPYLSRVISTTDPQKGRFSISDNRRSRVISVRISDVREDDGGVYYCGVRIGGNEVSSSIITTTTIIIIVSICVALLLIGGLTLICFIVILKKRKGIVHLDTQTVI
uniref:Ig-like domain-containing protein n=1 Tax=Astyanax mexicanus TaxID=7994 RepID=W5LEM4_ASTMX